jgi:hypothetical protein
MVHFESELFIGLPKWASYNDMLVFIDEFLQKVRKPNKIKLSRNSSSHNSFEDLGNQEGLKED